MGELQHMGINPISIAPCQAYGSVLQRNDYEDITQYQTSAPDEAHEYDYIEARPKPPRPRPAIASPQQQQQQSATEELAGGEEGGQPAEVGSTAGADTV